ncbi:MAG: flavin reductase [Oscillospiraceae bacterium]|nr:flavin reductase [Oscillospiraceae bacterium]MCR4759086.1 flavin reductase [Oscillospiraceae bacterium]
MALQKINPEQISGNPFEAIGKQWFLLTAGSAESGWNCMTCSWGALGVLWNKPSVTCYVRHSRHTFGFMEQQDMFTLSFLGSDCRKALSFCGSHSGRDCDKAAEAGLHPVETDGGITFDEAELVLVCKKRYAADMNIADLPADAAAAFYADNDTHRLYIGEIVACYQKAE